MMGAKRKLNVKPLVPPKKTLPPDPDNQNGDRSDWADAAITAFIRETQTDHEDAAADLIADLGHWCDRNGYDFKRQVERGIGNYEEETS